MTTSHPAVTEVEVPDHLKQMTDCNRCRETFRDPRILPCIHTFCLSCISQAGTEANTRLGEQMPCPLCRKEFTIPMGGFEGLEKNFFIQRMVEMKKFLAMKASGQIPCDVCNDETANESNAVVFADRHCHECNLNICEQCCAHHRKSRLTREHSLREGAILTNARESEEVLQGTMCQRHTDEEMKLYCKNCLEMLCSMCFIENHQGHERSSVDEVGSDFYRQIQATINDIDECASKATTRKELIEREMERITKRTEQLEKEVIKRREYLKELIDTHAKFLLEQVRAREFEELKEVAALKYETELHLVCLESYKDYSSSFLARATSDEICKTVFYFDARASELRKENDAAGQHQLSPCQLSFTATSLDKFSNLFENIVGKIEVDQNAAMQGKVRDGWLEDHLLKPEKLQQELNESYATINGSKSTIDCLQDLDSSLHSVIDNQILELEREKSVSTNLRTAIDQKNVELFKEGASRDKKCKQHCDEIMIITTSNMHLQTIIEKQKQELDFEKVAKMSLLKKRETLQKELEECRIQVGEIHQRHEKQISELNATQEEEMKAWSTIADLLQKKINDKDQLLAEQRQIIETSSEKIKRLEEPLALVKQTADAEATSTKGKKAFMRNPVLVQTLKTHLVEDESRPIWGVTSLNNELYIVTDGSSLVEVYDLVSLNFARRWDLKKLRDPQDITSCAKNKCLYVMDWDLAMILKVDPNGLLITEWSVPRGGGRLSVTRESNVLFTVYKQNKLIEYRADGYLIRDIKLSAEDGIAHPQHAVKLANGDFVVSHGVMTDPLHRVCVVDGSGRVLKSIGGKPGLTAGRVNLPLHLAVNSDGCILVADWNNSRVLLLNSQLEFKRELLSKRDGLRFPGRICLPEANDRLIVADNLNGWSDGQVRIFDMDNDLCFR